MIAFIRGQVLIKNLSSAVVETNNIGYQVFLSESTLADLAKGSEVELYIHHQVREESSDLYGFKTPEDMELFELLLTVSGIGPKSALGILNLASAGDIREAIIRADASLLTKVAGIGKKTADRLVLELKNKVTKIVGAATGLSSAGSCSSDELDALMALGYSLSEARDALSQISSELVDSGERIKAALRLMSRR